MKRRDKSGPKLGGFDYIVAAADKAADTGRTDAWYFKNMVESAALGEHMGALDAIATRSLKDVEAAAATPIAFAHAMALENGDLEAAKEVVMAGVMLIAKWHVYRETVVPIDDGDWSESN